MNNRKTAAIMFAVGIGTFMSALDSSAVNLAMPLIKKDFGISLSMVEWIVTTYLLVVSSLLLTFGRIADLYGQKKVYCTGFIIFTVGSLFCGISMNVYLLIGSRIIQALGAGMLFATGPAIITNAVSAEKRGKALSVTAIAVALGLCMGPVIGGTLTTLLGWQSIFYINIPIGIIGTIIVMKNIPHDTKTTSIPFDMVGSSMIFAALLLILLPLNLSGDYALSLPLFITLILFGILMLLVFLLYERKCKYPMLNLDLFRNRVFAGSNAAALFLYMAQFIMIFLIPFYMQNLRMYSALISGILYLPLPLATMMIAPISGAISDHFDSRFLSVAGTIIAAIGFFMLSFLKTDTSVAYIIVSMIIVGTGFGMFQTPNNSAIMGNVPVQNRGTASGTLATMRNIGMALGVAISGSLFSLYENHAKQIYTGNGITGKELHDSVFVYALHYTFIFASIVALISMVASLAKGKVKTELKK